MNDNLQAMKIFLAVDGSEHAMAAVELLHDLPNLDCCTIKALAVLDARYRPGKHALLSALERSQARLEESQAVVLTELLQGHPAAALSETADREKPDLIVMGAVGLRATLGILLGGVAQQVVEYAHFPVLVVRAPYRGIHSVLVMVDGSQYSQRAIDFIGRFPLPPGAEITLMHVMQPLPAPEMMFQSWPPDLGIAPTVQTQEVLEALDREAQDEELQAENLLSRMATRLGRHGRKAGTVLVRGDTVTEVLDHLKTQPTDLIVAGSRGLSQVRGWLLGSVSRKLVHYAPCSVLIVKGEDG